MPFTARSLLRAGKCGETWFPDCLSTAPSQPFEKVILPMPAESPAAVPNRGAPMAPVSQASSILASLGHAAFQWDLATDGIAWSESAGAVFTDIPPEALSSGAGF